MKPFTLIVEVLLSLIAILQLARFVLGWEVSVNGVSIPVWLSGIAFVVLVGLAVMLWRESRTQQPAL
jgi:membrane protein implicated in regulation of membrane protease activity